MKKLFLKVVTVMLLLTMILPLSVNAATSLITKTPEIVAGEIVEIEVTTEKAQSIQFDLQYDSTKYEYVVDSATSDLNKTASNYMSEDVIRVSAFDMNGVTTDTVKLKFRANKGTGTGDFKIATVELVDEKGNTKIETQPQELTVKVNDKIQDPDVPAIVDPKDPNNNTGDGTTSTGTNNSGEYVDGTGEKIKTLGNWGEIPPIRIYDNLTNLTGKNIVAYALETSDVTLSRAQLQKEFGNQIVVADDILGTGKTFTLNGEIYTILIYGDVNGDGKVTTADALTARKAEQGKIRTLTDVQKEALDVVKINQKDDETYLTNNALAIQNFILGNKYGEKDTKTVLDKFPETTGNLIDGIGKDDSSYKAEDLYRYQTIKLAEVTAKNTEATNTEKIKNDKSLTYELAIEGVGVDPVDAEVTFEPIQGKDGIYLMSLYTPYIGKHTIRPILVGANVKDGVYKDESEEGIVVVNVIDNNEVSALTLKDENGNDKKDAQGNYIKEVDVRPDTEQSIDIGFVHRYTNQNGEVIADVPLTVATATVTGTTGSVESAEFVETEGNITAIKVKTTDTEKTTGTVTISVGNITEIITINVLEKAKNVGIKLGETSITNKNIVTEIAPITINKTEDFIIPIQLIDEDGVTSDLQNSNIETTGYEIEVDDIDAITMAELEALRKNIDDANADTGKIVIYEAGKNGVFGAMNISAKTYKWTNDANYEEATSTSGVDAIGIRLSPDFEDIANLKDGIMIAYSSIDANGNACRRTVRIPVAAIYDENGDNLLATVEEPEVQTDEPEVQEETTATPVTTKVELPEQQSVAPVTTPSTTPEVETPVAPTTTTSTTGATTDNSSVSTENATETTTTTEETSSTGNKTTNTSTGTTTENITGSTAGNTVTGTDITEENQTSSNDATRTEGAKQDKPGNSSLLAPVMD